eukprot:scaffold1090_cov265-Pinguiococcus_pyrenoidosus.AAC.15
MFMRPFWWLILCVWVGRSLPVGRVLRVHPARAPALAASNMPVELEDRARSQLVLSAMGIVHSFGRKYATLGILSKQDLEQEGVLGLLKAVERYDPSRANKFSTYAYHFVERAMLDALARHGTGAGSVPPGFFKDMARFRTAREKLERSLGRPPAIAEVSAEIGVSEEKAELLLRQANAVLSLSSGDVGGRALSRRGRLRPSRDASSAVESAVESSSEAIAAVDDPQDYVHKVRMEEELRNVICDEASGIGADPLGIRVLELRYGLQLSDRKRPQQARDDLGEAGMTREQVARRLGIASDEVAEVEQRVFARLRASSSAVRRLAPYANMAEGDVEELVRESSEGVLLGNDQSGESSQSRGPVDATDGPKSRKTSSSRRARNRRGVLRKSILDRQRAKEGTERD